MLAGMARIIFAAIGVTMVIAIALDATGIVKNTLEQKIPPKDMVGRVDTLNTTFTAVSVALGALAGAFIGRAVTQM